MKEIPNESLEAVTGGNSHQRRRQPEPVPSDHPKSCIRVYDGQGGQRLRCFPNFPPPQPKREIIT